MCNEILAHSTPLPPGCDRLMRERSTQIEIFKLTEDTQELGKSMVPKKLFFTKGVGKHKERLTSFELALRDAGIASQNLVRVSSIFPPRCKVITRKEGLRS